MQLSLTNTNGALCCFHMIHLEWFTSVRSSTKKYKTLNNVIYQFSLLWTLNTNFDLKHKYLTLIFQQKVFCISFSYNKQKLLNTKFPPFFFFCFCPATKCHSLFFSKQFSAITNKIVLNSIQFVCYDWRRLTIWVQIV